nr:MULTISPECIES: hypothetical protein [Streptomyces]
MREQREEGDDRREWTAIVLRAEALIHVTVIADREGARSVGVKGRFRILAAARGRHLAPPESVEGQDPDVDAQVPARSLDLALKE